MRIKISELTRGQKFIVGNILLFSGNITENPNSIPFKAIESTTGSTMPIVLIAFSMLVTGVGFTIPFWWSQVKRMRGTQPFRFDGK